MVERIQNTGMGHYRVAHTEVQLLSVPAVSTDCYYLPALPTLTPTPVQKSQPTVAA